MPPLTYDRRVPNPMGERCDDCGCVLADDADDWHPQGVDGLFCGECCPECNNPEGRS